MQSYGSRAVKPPIIYGDVKHIRPLSVKEVIYAQSLTDRPVKGMLTGPITITNWSFERSDISRADLFNQIGLAIKDEIKLLEDAGIAIIQVDEAAPVSYTHLDVYKRQVVTNSIHHAAKLVDKNIQTIIIGGHVKKSTDASIGAVAYEQIKQLNFDKAFLGINGIDEEFLTTPDMEEAVIKKTVIENARKSYIVTDSSKIGRVSFAKVDKIENATIITNQSSGALMKKIKENTRVIEV